MSAPHPVDESLLIDLLNNLLAPPEREAVLAHVRRCPACEQQMRMLAQERESVRAHSVPVLEHERLVLKPRRARAPVWAVVTAAAVLVLVALVPSLQRERRGVEYWIPAADDNGTVLRSAQVASGLQPLDDVLKAYTAHDAARAVEALRAYDAHDDATAFALRGLFLASALLNADRPGQALVTLDGIRASTLPLPWRSEALWVQYLALARLGRNAEARAVLRSLEHEPGAVGDNARRALKGTDG